MPQSIPPSLACSVAASLSSPSLFACGAQRLVDEIWLNETLFNRISSFGRGSFQLISSNPGPGRNFAIIRGGLVQARQLGDSLRKDGAFGVPQQLLGNRREVDRDVDIAQPTRSRRFRENHTPLHILRRLDKHDASTIRKLLHYNMIQLIARVPRFTYWPR